MLEFVSRCQEELQSNDRALAYLMRERHVSAQTIKDCQLGYCPYGFIQRNAEHPELSSLKGRITVPIFSEFGKLVGIAGRVPDGKVKGWWNTTFTKSAHLYGFNEARKHIFEKNKAYIFEGYLDRIIMRQSGLPNSVAVMSSSLGMRRVGLLARYCDEVCLCFDTDANDAGRLGLLKTISELNTVGFGRSPMDSSDEGAICRNVSMVRLPVGVDPDEYVMKNGLDGFLALEQPLSLKQMALAGAACEELKEQMRVKRRNKK